MIKIGLFGVGLDTYWKQFDGLLERLIGYQLNISGKLKGLGTQVIDAGMVDNPFKANKAAELFNGEQVDALVLFVSTYALSHNVLPLIQKTNVPVIILNLQPVRAINYGAFNAIGDRGEMTGEWLAHCQSCVTPELASVFNRANVKFNLISGYLEEEYVWNEMQEFIGALEVIKTMKYNRVGLLGHYYNGMMDVYTDLTQQSTTFGNHFEIIELGTLKKISESISENEVLEKIKKFNSVFEVSSECKMDDINQAAKTSAALDKLIDSYKLGSMAYYYEGDGDLDYKEIVSSLIPGLTLLTGRNVPVAGEYEVKNVQAMKILDILGCGGSFSEFYAMDYEEDVILLGHDGPAHFKMAEGKVSLVPLPVYHGKQGKGLSVQMEVKNGPVTLLSVGQNVSGNIFLLAAEGESIAGPTLQIGNTNSRYKFPLHNREFINNWAKAGPSHHCAIGTGHKASVIHKIASFLDIDCFQIC